MCITKSIWYRVTIVIPAVFFTEFYSPVGCVFLHLLRRTSLLVLTKFQNLYLGGGFKKKKLIPTWGNDPIWLIIFFKWVETTNQLSTRNNCVIHVFKSVWKKHSLHKCDRNLQSGLNPDEIRISFSIMPVWQFFFILHLAQKNHDKLYYAVRGTVGLQTNPT